ncbi:hypothetical protein C8R43DRAFT_952769 [Mycena crocata]|nr:hypothetical protein C8R43DRAFT_952769 [Mycena crocata]
MSTANGATLVLIYGPCEEDFRVNTIQKHHLADKWKSLEGVLRLVQLPDCEMEKQTVTRLVEGLTTITTYVREERIPLIQPPGIWIANGRPHVAVTGFGGSRVKEYPPGHSHEFVKNLRFQDVLAVYEAKKWPGTEWFHNNIRFYVKCGVRCFPPACLGFFREESTLVDSNGHAANYSIQMDEYNKICLVSLVREEYEREKWNEAIKERDVRRWILTFTWDLAGIHPQENAMRITEERRKSLLPRHRLPADFARSSLQFPEIRGPIWQWNACHLRNVTSEPALLDLSDIRLVQWGVVLARFIGPASISVKSGKELPNGSPYTNYWKKLEHFDAFMNRFCDVQTLQHFELVPRLLKSVAYRGAVIAPEIQANFRWGQNDMKDGGLRYSRRGVKCTRARDTKPGEQLVQPETGAKHGSELVCINVGITRHMGKLHLVPGARHPVRRTRAKLMGTRESQCERGETTRVAVKWSG